MSTTADLLNKLVSQKNTLADNLVEKGVEATHDETLKTLVPKVLDIIQGNDITAKGNPVQIDGLQGGVPFSEMAVSGKNLIGISQAKALTGDNTNGFYIFDNTASRVIVQKLQPNTTYHLKKYDSGNRFRIVMFNNEPTNAADTTAIQLIYNSDGSMLDYTLTTGENHLWMVLATHYATSGEAIEPIVQLEYGDTATAYEPPITGQNITLWECKKNMMCYPYWVEKQGGTLEHNGITYTLNADMSISANGTATADSYGILQHLTMSPNVNRLIKNTDYFFSGTPAGGSEYTYRMYVGIYDNDGNRIAIYHDYGSGVSIKIANDYRCTAAILIKKGQTVSNLIFRPQLELGSAATDYEMPSGTSYAITTDSNPYVIPNDVRQQDGLNTISVSAGTLSVTGVRKNAAIKRIWDEIDEIKTAIIVSNGET